MTVYHASIRRKAPPAAGDYSKDISICHVNRQALGYSRILSCVTFTNLLVIDESVLVTSYCFDAFLVGALTIFRIGTFKY